MNHVGMAAQSRVVGMSAQPRIHADPEKPASGQICAMFAVDIAGFTRPDRDDDVLMYLRKALYGMLEEAFDRSGISWTSCSWEDRGDGVLVVVPLTSPPIALSIRCPTGSAISCASTTACLPAPPGSSSGQQPTSGR